MKVKDLIERLQMSDPETEVVVSPATYIKYGGSIGEGGVIDIDGNSYERMPNFWKQYSIEGVSEFRSAPGQPKSVCVILQFDDSWADEIEDKIEGDGDI